MLDPDNSENVKRERSLLALGETLRGAAEHPPSRLATALAEVRAEQGSAERHRSARSRRDVRPNPLLAALGVRTAPDADPIAPASTAIPAAPPTDPTPDDATVEKPALHTEPGADASRAATEASVRDEADLPSRTTSRRDDAVERADEPDSDAAENGDRGEAGSDTQWKPLIDPGKVIAGVRRSKKLIAATTIAGALLGVAIAVTTPKKYEASAELLADPRDLNLVDKELTQSGLSNEATLAIVENQVRILRSGTVLSQVIDKLHLDQDPEFNGTGPASGLGGVIQTVKSLISRGDSSDDPGRRNAVANENLAKSLNIERGGKTFVIVISATTLSGEKSALIANTMTDVFLKAYGQLQSDAAGRAADELTGKLDELRASVEVAERKVETFKAENDIIDPQGRLITDDEIVKLNEQLSVARARTLELNARAASMRAFNVDAVLKGVLPEELASATIQELRAQYSTLKSEADRLDVRLGPKHPQRQAIDAQLNGARDLINAELTRIVSSAQTELKRAVQLEQELSSRLAQLKVRQGSLSNEMVTLRELERDSTAKRAVYEAFLLRARETGEQRGINSANMSVISTAFPPLNPNPPSRSTIALSGLMLGFLAGVGMGVARGTWSSLADTATGRPPTTVWRRRRRSRQDEPAPALPTPRRAPPPPEPAGTRAPVLPAAIVAPVHEAVATQTEIHPEPHEPHLQPAGEPAEPRETSMPDPIYGDYQAFAAAQAQAVQQPHPYPQPMAPAYPQAPMHPGVYLQPYQPAPQMAPAYPQPFAGQPGPGTPMAGHPGYYWQHPQMMPPPAAYPHVQPGSLQAGMYGAQPPMPVYPPQTTQPADTRQQAAAAPEPSQIEEIRASLRECREAIRDLTESRSKRRYF